MSATACYDGSGRDAALRFSVAAGGCQSMVVVTILPEDHAPASWLAERGPTGLRAWNRSR